MILSGIRVIDLSRHISGPYCSSLLADWGAEIIRIEQPGGDEDRRFGHLSPSGVSYTFANRNRNKKSITLNLSHASGKEVLRRLVEKSDIVLENFAVQDKEKLGLDYGSLRTINPAIILASVSAYGLTGPNRHKVGFDPIAQGVSGSMAFTGFPGNPPTRAAVAWTDYAAALHAAYGIMLALRDRDKTGEGQMIDVSLADSAAGIVALHGVYAEYEKLGVVRPQTGNASPYAYADAFQAKDGWVFVSLARHGLWKRFLGAVGKSELEHDPRFKTDWDRVQNRDKLSKLVMPWISARTVAEVVSTLEKVKVPCQRINSVAEACAEPQYRERDILVQMDHPGIGRVSTLGVIAKLSRTHGSLEKGAPQVGESNAEILGGLLGYTEEDLAQLRAGGVI